MGIISQDSARDMVFHFPIRATSFVDLDSINSSDFHQFSPQATH